MDFEKAFNYVLDWEGKLGEISENPNDPGGVTRWGISLRFLKSLEPERLNLYGIHTLDADTIKNLTKDTAKQIYRKEFWDMAPYDKINSQNLCNYIFDMHFNMGIAPAVKCVQRAICAIESNRAVIVDDGIFGSETLKCINVISIPLLPPIKSERAGYYRLLAEKHEGWKVFLDGWLNRAYGN